MFKQIAVLLLFLVIMILAGCCEAERLSPPALAISGGALAVGMLLAVKTERNVK